MHLDAGRVVMFALIDLSAAFDTISHDKLTQLLEVEYGVQKTALSWFQSYFTSRQQHINIGTFQSEDLTLESGRPHGSVIGPVGYNLYTAPLGRIIERHGMQYHKYADDLQLYTPCKFKDIVTV